MAERLHIISERVDDIPLVLAQLERMSVQPLLDEHFPTHGNWVGLSLGWVTVIWLTQLLQLAFRSAVESMRDRGCLRSWHHITAGTNRRRDRHPHRLPHLARAPLQRGAAEVPVLPVADRDLG
jgi:hypothetical protein